ncbi:hypothetical protein QTP88_000338 [Uroleucon formosanum]
MNPKNMLSEKLKPLRVVNNYKFRFYRLLANDVQQWVCYKKTCNAAIKYDVNGTICEQNTTHNHEPDDLQSILRQKISNSVKRKAVEQFSERPAKIIHSEIVFSDFEQAIHTAIKDVWPTTNLKACRFHLGQAWFRKMQSLGLAKPYMKPGEMSEYLKLFFGLPFLRPDEVDDCFVTDIMALLPPNNSKLTAFTDYILEVYVREDSRYPPSLWAEYFGYTLHLSSMPVCITSSDAVLVIKGNTPQELQNGRQSTMIHRLTTNLRSKANVRQKYLDCGRNMGEKRKRSVNPLADYSTLLMV